jgi:DNA-binding XRE family transcriptional regulator
MSEANGNNLRALREKAGLAQEGLSRRANVSTNTIVRLETRPEKTPTLATARKIARALGVAVESIWPTEVAS